MEFWIVRLNKEKIKIRFSLVPIRKVEINIKFLFGNEIKLRLDLL